MADMTERSQFQLRPGPYLGEISALCLLPLPPYLSPTALLLAGTGSQIMVYDLAHGNLSRSFQVFRGIRVHGISLEDGHREPEDSTLTFRIAVFGEKRVKLLELQIGSHNLQHEFQNMKLTLVHDLPNFCHWVLDVCFLKDRAASHKDSCYIAVGCTDNSLHFWDILRANIYSEVKCSERCLLYSMRMFGNEIESLLVASGTIFNQIIVWKLVYKNHVIQENHAEHVEQINEGSLLSGLKYEGFIIRRLIGHEGSIFRIAWFCNGSKLISVSDDRSGRIWEVQAEKVGYSSNLVLNGVKKMEGPVLFGHNARIWDCCIFDSLIITAGEDCTCRVWDHNGKELAIIKEHTGRGVWRCLYDPNSSVIVTAGFDSSIKVHHLYKFQGVSVGITPPEDSVDKKEFLSFSLPNSSKLGIHMDSKSEYVRCMHFSREDSLYVATNNGYLYHACLFDNGAVKWTQLVHVREATPIICMDLFSNCSNRSGGFDDWVAVGDGKGNMTVVRVVGSVWNPKVELTLTWSAEKDRCLLGTYWCTSLKNRFIFTTDPAGRLKLWSLCRTMPSASISDTRSYDASLIAEFVSCFGLRIMCVDSSFDEGVLVCGDVRGNLLLFSLPCGLLCRNSAEIRSSPTNYFKGAHGISSVCSVFLTGLCSEKIEIRSTGADGCICYFQYDRNLFNLKFLGMKQVKKLSVVRAVFSITDRTDDSLFGTYAVGFASENFMVWDLTTETKVIQITCGGWRRPHSYYLGHVPEIKNCFAFVKDDSIHIHRCWLPEIDLKILPRNLHIQFHGREIHSLCFISGNSLCENRELVSKSRWIATGCEDGTIRLTRYDPGTKTWSTSKYLGDHVVGSAIRAISFVSKSYTFMPDSISTRNWVCGKTEALDDTENPAIIITVGAKKVISAWRQVIRTSEKPINIQCCKTKHEIKVASSFTSENSAMLFHWLSTDKPIKYAANVKRPNTMGVHKIDDIRANSSGSGGPSCSEFRVMDLHTEDDYANDWRYLDVSAFQVKDARSRISACFVVVSCSDATVSLRALVMPFRHWFDVASLSPLSSPVLALRHVVIPKLLPSEGSVQFGNLYLAICGSTDGSIAFWDLTKCVEIFMQQISGLQMENCMEFKKRPNTGRGSQGGRQWRSTEYRNPENKSGHEISLAHNGLSEKSIPGVSVCSIPTEAETQNLGSRTFEICSSEERDSLVSTQIREQGSDLIVSPQVGEKEKESLVPPKVREQVSCTSEGRKNELIQEPTVVAAAHVLNGVHQSGVNCLHVSDIKYLKCDDPKLSFYVVSGGDDQAISCIRCDLEIYSVIENSEFAGESKNCFTRATSDGKSSNRCQIQAHTMKVELVDQLSSAHSSAVKGAWTDGSWVFSTGVDQRVRCWKIEHDRLVERGHLIISVPEPEAMDVYACGRDYYQITVAGRGMQMVEFYADNGEP